MGHRYDTMRNAAFDTAGRRMWRLIMAWEAICHVGPWVLAAAILGGVGWLAHRVWVWVADRLHQASLNTQPAPAAPHHALGALSAVPAWLWVLGALLALALVWMCRPGGYPTPGQKRLRVIPVFGLVIVAAGIAGLALAGPVGV